MLERIALAPLLVLLFILPFRGTVALRLLCLTAAFLIAMALWRRAAVPRLPCKAAIGAWALVALLSLVYAANPAYSLAEIKNEIGYAMLAFVAFFVLTRRDRDLGALAVALGAGAVVLSTWVLRAGFLAGEWNEAGRYGGKASYATYSVTILPIFLLGALYFGNPRYRAAALGTTLLVLLTVFFSGQRIVWPVVCLQILLALAWLRHTRKVDVSVRAVVAIGVVVFLAAGAIFVAAQSQRFKGDDAVTTVTSDNRLAQMPKVVERILGTPWTGSGFGRQAMRMAHQDLIPSGDSLLWHAHNSFLNYGLSMGLPGIAVLVLLFLSLLWNYIRFLRDDDPQLQLLGLAGVLMILGVLLRNQVNDMFVRDSALLFWALNGALLGLGHRKLRLKSAVSA
jgi:O-antigen ligase